jgi:AraC family transcriptional regulator
MNSLPTDDSVTSPQTWNAAQGYLDMQATERPQDVVETRSLGPLSMLEVAQGAGRFLDAAAPVFALQTLISANCNLEIDYGGQKVHSPGLRSGDMVFSPVNTSCGYLLDAPHVVLAIPIPLTAVKSVAAHVMPSFGGDFSALHSRVFTSNTLRKCMHTLWRAAAGDAKAPSLDPHAEALALIEQLLRLSVDPKAIKPQRHHLAPHTRQHVLDYIQAHLAEDVSLPQLAQIAGLSDYYFMRAFKAEMGITAHQYVLQQRIYRAIRLLRISKLPIAQVALDCGFASHQHMSTVFNALRGRTPQAVRSWALG